MRTKIIASCSDNPIILKHACYNALFLPSPKVNVHYMCISQKNVMLDIAGDHIRVVGKFYNHHMLVADKFNDGRTCTLKVIHYTVRNLRGFSILNVSHNSISHGTKGKAGTVLEEDYIIKDGAKLEVLTYTPPSEQLHSTDEAIEHARTRLGEMEYNVFFNNCESFVNWALTSNEKSSQGSRATAETIKILSAGRSGAAVGGIVGTSVGPIGTVIGSAIGSLVGLASTGAVSFNGILLKKQKMHY